MESQETATEELSAVAVSRLVVPSSILYGSVDRCWNCSKGYSQDGHLEYDSWDKDLYCSFAWKCPECGYLQKSQYKINLSYSVAGTPLSRSWTGKIPQHTSIEQQKGTPVEFDHALSEDGMEAFFQPLQS